MKTKLISILSVVLLVSVLSLIGCTSSKDEVGEEALYIISNGYSTDKVETEAYRLVGIKPEVTVEKDTVVFTFDISSIYVGSVERAKEIANTARIIANDISRIGKENLDKRNNKGHVRVVFIYDGKDLMISEDGKKVK